MFQQKLPKKDKNLKKRIANTYTFSSHNINKFMMVLRKGVYPYEYKDVWEKYQLKYLHSLPEKEDFYYHLNMEDITNADYTQAKKSL